MSVVAVKSVNWKGYSLSPLPEVASEVFAGIYVILHKGGKLFYVGSAQNMHTRRGWHFSASKWTNIHLHRAMNKYGRDAFQMFVLERVSTDLSKPDFEAALIEREQYWIDTLDAVAKGYNLSPTAGSNRGYRHTAETKQQMSESRQIAVIQYNAKGQKVARYESVKAAANATGFSASNICKVLKGKLGFCGGFQWGYEGATAPTVQTRSHTSTVAQIDLSTGKTIKVYSSMSLAARENGTNKTRIAAICRGEAKPFNAFGWAFVTPNLKA